MTFLNILSAWNWYYFRIVPQDFYLVYNISRNHKKKIVKKKNSLANDEIFAVYPYWFICDIISDFLLKMCPIFHKDEVMGHPIGASWDFIFSLAFAAPTKLFLIAQQNSFAKIFTSMETFSAQLLNAPANSAQFRDHIGFFVDLFEDFWELRHHENYWGSFHPFFSRAPINKKKLILTRCGENRPKCQHRIRRWRRDTE